MYRKVLVPLDGSELAECALTHVKSMVKAGAFTSVVLCSVAEVDVPLHYMDSDNAIAFHDFDFQAYGENLLDTLKRYLARLKESLHEEGVDVETLVLKGGKPAQIISDYVTEQGIDLIVIASHGFTGMKKLIFGSVAMSLLHDTAVPVLLIKPEACQV